MSECGWIRFRACKARGAFTPSWGFTPFRPTGRTRYRGRPTWSWTSGSPADERRESVRCPSPGDHVLAEALAQLIDHTAQRLISLGIVRTGRLGLQQGELHAGIGSHETRQAN